MAFRGKRERATITHGGDSNAKFQVRGGWTLGFGDGDWIGLRQYAWNRNSRSRNWDRVDGSQRRRKPVQLGRCAAAGDQAPRSASGGGAANFTWRDPCEAECREGAE